MYSVQLAIVIVDMRRAFYDVLVDVYENFNQ
ncbi:Uncharacterised protein [Chryseobacterium gleum]|jgi:hypothetical protein|uniref:Uncharacterized protein n=1 Tax=Chryseobacterium gleum TaxID=250 RepID=A0A3S4M8J6_CHRGE|nr:Uncharacterised protein [Chryseobacterium gleum]